MNTGASKSEASLGTSMTRGAFARRRDGPYRGRRRARRAPAVAATVLLRVVRPRPRVARHRPRRPRRRPRVRADEILASLREM